MSVTEKKGCVCVWWGGREVDPLEHQAILKGKICGLGRCYLTSLVSRRSGLFSRLLGEQPAGERGMN